MSALLSESVDAMTEYLIFFAIVLGINLLPAFGPPTWSIIVLYGINTNLRLVPLVLTAAIAAALGRLVLAHVFRLLGNHLPERTRRNLNAAGALLERKKRNAIFGLALFAISPLPSAQLFEAAGLAGVRLVPFTAAFFVGRLFTYTFYAATAQNIRGSSLSQTFMHGLTSPAGIALQLATLALFIILSQIDWEKHLHRKTHVPEVV